MSWYLVDWLILVMALLGTYSIFVGATAANLIARGNGPMVVTFGAMYWPVTWVFIALRGLSRFLESADRVRDGKGFRP